MTELKMQNPMDVLQQLDVFQAGDRRCTLSRTVKIKVYLEHREEQVALKDLENQLLQ